MTGARSLAPDCGTREGMWIIGELAMSYPRNKTLTQKEKSTSQWSILSMVLFLMWFEILGLIVLVGCISLDLSTC